VSGQSLPPRRRGERRLRPTTVLAAGVLLSGAAVLAHVHLVNSSNGNPLRWSSPSSISIVLQADGSDDLPAGGHLTALRGAIRAWNATPDTSVQLVEDTSSVSQAREDWESNDLHSILFDEDNASGYFPSGSGIVAITPIFFSSGGSISDADILFNGRGFRFTTSGQAGRFDVEDVAAHELGHLLGLDHTPWAGATMYPYVDPVIILHRSPSLDDQRGMRDAYPSGSDARITGVVVRGDASPVSGAHVVARGASGRPYAGTLSKGDGSFELRGLDGGTYSLYAAPVNGPVTAANLGVTQAIHTDFEATPLGAIAVGTGAVADGGTLVLGAESGIALGRVSDDFPKRIVQGRSTHVILRGNGFDPAGSLTASDPSLTIENVSWTTVSVQFDVVVPAGSPTGHVDLEATNVLGERAILTGGLEITPPDPVVDSITPTQGLAAGGANLSLSGSGFRPGLRVVIGDRIYEDGVAGGCTRLDSTRIALTLGETMGGAYDVVVIDPSGIEGRLVAGFLVLAEPGIDTVFPSSGSSAGGTRLSITGDSFAAGAQVTIDGVPQVDVAVESTSRLLVVTEPGNAGGPYVLTVTNPGGETASAGFSYAAKPDPLILALDPPTGSASGGDTVMVQGQGFVPGSEVLFGVDGATGQGGSPVQEVQYIDANTLQILTPQLGSGAKTVLVRDPATAQASVLESGFTYEGSDDEGGGCFGVVSSSPPSWRRVLANSGWMLVLLAYAALVARRRSVPATQFAA
jgi:hypothetical protein